MERRVNTGSGCGAFCMAQRTIQGGEALYRFRTGQVEGLAKEDGLAPNRLITQPFGLAVSRALTQPLLMRQAVLATLPGLNRDATVAWLSVLQVCAEPMTACQACQYFVALRHGSYRSVVASRVAHFNYLCYLLSWSRWCIGLWAVVRFPVSELGCDARWTGARGHREDGEDEAK